MSAIFKREIASLVRAVAKNTADETAERLKNKAQTDRARKGALAHAAKYRAEIRAAILAVLRQHGRSGTVKIGRALGKERSSTLKHLKEMSEEGLVIRFGERLSPEWEAAAP